MTIAMTALLALLMPPVLAAACIYYAVRWATMALFWLAGPRS